MASHLSIVPTTLHREVKANALLEMKDEMRAGGQKISINDILLLATARALRNCAWMRVSLLDGTIIHRNAVHLGMAVATERGLLVPVIRDADTLSFSEISALSRKLADKAREGKLSMDDLQGAVFSVSNLGMYGITTFTPVINAPEAGILGLGCIRHSPVHGGQGEVVEESVMDISLTIDHRLIDGAQGALFLQEFANIVEGFSAK